MDTQFFQHYLLILKCFFLFLPILHMPPLLPKKGQGGDQNPRVRRNDCTLMCTDGHHCRKQNACYPIPSCWNAGITVPLAPCPNGHFVMVPSLNDDMAHPSPLLLKAPFWILPSEVDQFTLRLGHDTHWFSSPCGALYPYIMIPIQMPLPTWWLVSPIIQCSALGHH